MERDAITLEELKLKDEELKKRQFGRVSLPNFSTVLFAGVQAGQVGFLTRRWTKGLFKQALGLASDRLLEQVRGFQRATPKSAQDVFLSVFSPFQYTAYVQIAKAREPGQKPPSLAYLPLQTQGQMGQLLLPQVALGLTQQVIGPKGMEQLTLAPFQVSKQFRTQQLEATKQLRDESQTFARRVYNQISATRKLFQPEFWREQRAAQRESLMLKYQQGVKSVLDVAQLVPEGLPRDALQQLAQMNFKKKLYKQYGEYWVASLFGLQPVTVQDVAKSEEMLEKLARTTRIPAEEVKKRLKSLAEIRAVGSAPVGYGWFKKPGQPVTSLSEVIFMPSPKILFADVQTSIQRNLQIPYISFNPLRLFIPPTLETKLFGQAVVELKPEDVVPTLLGTMKQSDVQKVQQLAQRGVKEIQEQILRREPAQAVSSLQQKMQLQVPGLGETRLLSVLGTPIAMYQLGERQFIKRVEFMLPGFATPQRAVGSGVFRSYAMMLGQTTPRGGTDVLFSQDYNLQPNIFQTLYQKIATALGFEQTQMKLKRLQGQTFVSHEKATEAISELFQKLRQKGYFRKFYQSESLPSDLEMAEIWQKFFDPYRGKVPKSVPREVLTILSSLEPSEKSVVSELLTGTRTIMTEEWLSQTAKAGARSRREILQEIVYLSKVLGGQAPIPEVDEPIQRLLAQFSAFYQGYGRPSDLTNLFNQVALEELQGLQRRRLSGFRQALQSEFELESSFVPKTNEWLYIPEFLGIEQQKQLGDKAAVLKQFVPGLLESGTNRFGKLVTEPGLMLTHFFYRPVELMETLGLGGIDYTKVQNAFDILKRIFTQKIIPAAMGLSQLMTIDQLFGTGRIGFNTLGNFYVGSIQLLNTLGIGPMQRYIHTHAPSSLSTALQQIGLYGSGGEIQPQFVFGQIGQMLERTPTTQEQQLYQEGILNVEKRKSAGWEYGRGPYWGQYTQYYRPFLPYLYEKEWQYTENVFGSKFEYLAFGFPFPNLFNLFGLTWFLDPYHYERTRFYYRPYPVTGPMPFTEIPLIGPLLQPLSQLAKPKLNIFEDGWVRLQTGQAGFDQVQQSFYGVDLEQLKEFQTGGSSQITMSKQLSDYLGIVGFMSTQVTQKQISEELEFYMPKLQHSGTWGSLERLYYMSKLGNIFGLTEFIRRMIPHEEAGYPQYNPLINPYLSRFEWLPERFKTGDQYQTLDFGEVRLPGPQYEKTRLLLDNYGPIDQFLILQNVQPHSRQYELAKKRVLEMIESQPWAHDELTKFMVQQQIENAENVRRGMDVYKKFYTEPREEIELQLGEYVGGGMFKVPGKTYLVKISGLITDEEELAYRIYRTEKVSLEEQFRTAAQVKQSVEEQLKQLQGQTVKLEVFKDELQRYTYTESGDLVLEAGYRLEVPAVARDYSQSVQYATHGFNFLKQFWDVASQFVPETFLFEKFFAYRDPLEQYERYSVLGKQRMLWHRVVSDILVPNFNILRGQNPISAFLGGLTTGWLASHDTLTRLSGQMITGIQYAGQSMLPDTPSSETLRRWEFEEKMDYLNMLQDQLRGSRPSSLLGIQAVKGYAQLRDVVPLVYKKYVPHMANVPEEETQRVRAMLPDYIGQVMEQVWNAKRRAIIRQRQGQSLDFKTEVEKQVGEANADEYLQEIGDVLEFVDLRTYGQMRQLQEFSDPTQLSVTPQHVYQQMNSMLDQRYLTRKPYSTAMVNQEYLRQLQDSVSYMGERRVVLNQDRQQTRYNHFVRRVM